MASQLIATFKTNHGDIVVELFPTHAPKTVENFVGLAEGTKEWVDPKTGQISTTPFYDGLTFHRIIPNFMLLAMANAGPGTNGSQFFITTIATDWLNRKHTIFGEVVDDDSKAVVDAIGVVATDGFDRPIEPVVVEKVEIKRVEG